MQQRGRERERERVCFAPWLPPLPRSRGDSGRRQPQPQSSPPASPLAPCPAQRISPLVVATRFAGPGAQSDTIVLWYHWRFLNRGVELPLVERDQPVLILDEGIPSDSSDEPSSVTSLEPAAYTLGQPSSPTTHSSQDGPEQGSGPPGQDAERRAEADYGGEQVGQDAEQGGAGEEAVAPTAESSGDSAARNDD